MRQTKWIERIGVFAWCLAAMGYFFQFPFSILSSLIIPSLAVYFLSQLPNLHIPKDRKYLIGLGVYLLFIIFCVVRSLVLGVSLTRIIRFAAILVGIPAFCWIQDPTFSVKRKIFTGIAVIKSVVLIAIAVKLVIDGHHTLIRFWAQNNGLGDIYLLNGVPKVQVHGNALLVMAFVVEFLHKKRLNIFNIIILGGVLVAGNFAFILGLLLLVVWQGGSYAYRFIQKNKWGKYVVAVICLIAVIVLMPYFIGKIQEKADMSNVVRLEQAMVLLDANPIIGDGLGYVVQAETATRIYNGDIYFELQTLYIYKQIGLVGLLLFYFATILPMWYKSKEHTLLYLLYLAYTFWNPYCFDATQLMAVVLILNTNIAGAKYEKCTYYRLLPIRKSQG